MPKLLLHLKETEECGCSRFPYNGTLGIQVSLGTNVAGIFHDKDVYNI
jgi:hypothetical protein